MNPSGMPACFVPDYWCSNTPSNSDAKEESYYQKTQQQKAEQQEMKIYSENHC